MPKCTRCCKHSNDCGTYCNATAAYCKTGARSERTMLAMSAKNLREGVWPIEGGSSLEHLA
eukprot:5223875-Amphidinium_carterae.1